MPTHSRFLAHLATEQARLRQLAASTDPTAPVPSCPDWTADELTRHVAVVYLHKVECMRLGREPTAWPPSRADGSISAGPDRLLCWLWRRSGDDDVTWSGDHSAVARLRLALGVTTQ
jgi:hypothetical protein